MDLTQKFKCGKKPFEATRSKPSKGLSTLGSIHSTLHVQKGYRFVKAGCIVEARNEKFLLADHHSYSMMNVFNAIRITGTAELVTSSVSTHPVTGLKGARVDSAPKTLDVVYVRESDDKDEGFRIEKASYIVGQKVTVDDKLDGKRVQDVKSVLGVYLVEVA